MLHAHVHAHGICRSVAPTLATRHTRVRMSRVARECLLLLLCCSLLCHPALAFYGLAVPVASSTGTAAVPNVDCIFVYSCAPLVSSSILPPNTTYAFAELPAELVPSALSATVRPVYVGRAAGRCQRRLQQFKCKMVEAVEKENECRAAEWPDEDVTPRQYSITSVLHSSRLTDCCEAHLLLLGGFLLALCLSQCRSMPSAPNHASYSSAKVRQR